MRTDEQTRTPASSQLEVRKTVTVLFSDLVDSTALGSALDPEALRRLMSRYFEEMSAVLIRHGGTVEKYIGDAIMAVFGIPVVREDDALRALRAASEMRDRLVVLNEEVERIWGVRIATRTGVNSGEVVAGDGADGHLFATGEAVNVAKRLEEVAQSEEILIGEVTARLAGHDVRLEPTGPRKAKHGVRMDALRLVEVLPGAPGRALRFDSPLVGRERQLGSLVSAFTNAVTDRTCHLFTVLGTAGVGKSRLVEEFVRGLGADVRVLRGRCLPYGAGIAYWPVAEVVRDAVGGGPHGDDRQWVETIAAQVEGEPKAELIAERVAQALGLGGPSRGGESRVPLRRPGGNEDTFWALRKFFEAIARRQPLVVVFDDVHWGETTFLDLVEHIADFSRDAPMLLLCIGRPELLDERRGWGGGKLNATSILLEALSDGDCRQLIANLLDHASLPAEVENRIAAATGGNPFFTEELLAMLIDDELLTRRDGHWIASHDLSELPVPPTINALLAGHLERLPEDEQ